MAQKQFDRYIIQRELGRGGMATVYLAYDPRFERDVALKVLPHALLHDPTFRERFEREAKIIAGLEHGAIVPVYDYGEHQGQPFLVMRLMRGGSLKDRLKQSPLSLPQAYTILSRICAALDKAHAKKVIHRDLKPDNILFDEDHAPYLADFGIAKIIENTQTATFAGTYKYMAPEQAHGHPLNRRTDVYQMGVVLFEMLTGRVPFEAPTPAALLHQHAYAPIPSVQVHHATFPLEVDAVIAKAMAKNKDDRFATAGELATALGTVLTPKARPLPSRPKTATNRNPIPTADRLPKGQMGLLAGIIGIIGALLVVSIVLFQSTRGPFALSKAEIAATNTAIALASALPTATAAPTHTQQPTNTPPPTFTPFTPIFVSPFVAAATITLLPRATPVPILQSRLEEITTEVYNVTLLDPALLDERGVTWDRDILMTMPIRFTNNGDQPINIGDFQVGWFASPGGERQQVPSFPLKEEDRVIDPGETQTMRWQVVLPNGVELEAWVLQFNGETIQEFLESNTPPPTATLPPNATPLPILLPQLEEITEEIYTPQLVDPALLDQRGVTWSRDILITVPIAFTNNGDQPINISDFQVGLFASPTGERRQVPSFIVPQEDVVIEPGETQTLRWQVVLPNGVELEAWVLLFDGETIQEFLQ